MSYPLPPFYLRNLAIHRTRVFFADLGIEEAYTPLLVRSGAMEPTLDALEIRQSGEFLPTSPEFALKKSLALLPACRGLYEIAHAFRHDEPSDLHHREFAMLEWYERERNLLDLARRLTDLILFLQDSQELVLGDTGGISRKPLVFSVAELFEHILQVQISAAWPASHWADLAQKLSLPLPAEDLAQAKSDSLPGEVEQKLSTEIFTLIFDSQIEPQLARLGKLVFVKDYPPFSRGMAALNSSGWSDRLEAYLFGVEIGNGYQELSDPLQLKALWEQNNRMRKLANKSEHPLDELLLATTAGMQGVAGMAVGFDRLLMGLAGIKKIRELYSF